MKGDFFLNTGVKASILFFENTGETSELEFCEIVLKDGKIEETVLKTVKGKDLLEKGWSLAVNKYSDEKVKLSGLEYQKINDICVFEKKSKRSASFGNTTGKYRFFTSSMTEKLCDEADYTEESIIIGTGGNANIKFGLNFSCSADNFVIRPVKDNIKYVYYWLLSNISILSEHFHGSTIKHLSKESLQNIEIPIPPLEIQQQLVDFLDNQYSIIKTNRELIKMYEKQKASCVWTNTLNVETKTLGDICEVTQGTYITQEMKIKGEYPVYGGGDTNFWINQYNREDEIIIAKDGVSIDCVRYEPSKFFLSHHAWTLTCKNICKKYVFYYLYEHRNALYNIATGSAQKGINQKNFYAMTISIPSIDIQKRIVEKCEYYDSVIARLKTKIREHEETDIISQVLSSITSDITSEKEPEVLKEEKVPVPFSVCQTKLRGKGGQICGKPCIGNTAKCKTHKPKSPTKR
jgi:restriction endonuclease S subunit